MDPSGNVGGLTGQGEASSLTGASGAPLLSGIKADVDDIMGSSGDSVEIFGDERPEVVPGCVEAAVIGPGRVIFLGAIDALTWYEVSSALLQACTVCRKKDPLGERGSELHDRDHLLTHLYVYHRCVVPLCLSCLLVCRPRCSF